MTKPFLTLARTCKGSPLHMMSGISPPHSIKGRRCPYALPSIKMGFKEMLKRVSRLRWIHDPGWAVALPIIPCHVSASTRERSSLTALQFTGLGLAIASLDFGWVGNRAITTMAVMAISTSTIFSQSVIS